MNKLSKLLALPAMAVIAGGVALPASAEVIYYNSTYPAVVDYDYVSSYPAVVDYDYDYVTTTPVYTSYPNVVNYTTS
jgi:hypothetical protein